MSTSSQSPVTYAPLISPEGKLGYVPMPKVADAIASHNWQRAVPVITPQGKRAFVPQSKLSGAQAAGYKLVPEPGLRQDIDQFFAPHQERDTSIGNVANEGARGVVAGVVEPLIHPINTLEQAVTGPGTPIGEAKQIYDVVSGGGISKNNPKLMADQKSQADQARQMLEHPVYAAGSFAGQALLAHTAGLAIPRVVDTIKNVPESIRSAAESTASTGEAVRRSGEKQVASTLNAAKKNAINQHAYEQNVENHRIAAEERYKKAVEATNEANKKILQDAKDKHAADLKAAQDKNADIKSDWQDEVNRTKEENKAAEQALATRNSVKEELDKAAQERENLRAETQAKANAEYNAAWNNLRSKITEPVDMTHVNEVIKAQEDRMSPKSRSIFREMLQTGADAEELEDIRDKVMADIPTFAGKTYESLEPNARALVDGQVANYAALEGIDPDNPPAEASFSRVHSWTTEMNHKKLFGSPEAGNINSALKNVRNALREAEDEAARQSDASDDLENARALTVKYKEAFGRPLPRRLTAAELSEKQDFPERFAAKEQQKRIDAQAKYNPAIAEARDRVVRLHDLYKRLPDEETLRKQLKQPPTEPTHKYKPEPQFEEPTSKYKAAPKPEDYPPKPVKPPVHIESPEALDIPKIKKKAIDVAADRLRHIDKWQLRLMVRATGGAVLGAFVGGREGALAMGALGVTDAVAPVVMGKILNNARFAGWLAKGPSPEELRIMSRIDDSNLIRIRDYETGRAIDLIQAGVVKKVSPETLRFLGSKNARRIARAIAAGAVGATAANQNPPQEITAPASNQKIKIGSLVHYAGHEGTVIGVDPATKKLIIDWSGQMGAGAGAGAGGVQ